MKITNKSYILLPVYRSIFFYYCTFETTSKEKQDQIIIKALNIKNRKKRITYIYDEACNYVDNYYNKENICGFKNNQCYIQRKKKQKKTCGCCRKCIYKSNHGCTTKNLACKLFNCSEVYCRRKVIQYRDLRMLKVLSLRQRLIVKSDYFSLREDVLKDLYSYSIIYSSLRMLFRIIKNLFILKKMEKKKI
ncbi:MAG: hypothetical protein IKE70_02575 [Bacilli bacterium]|nr:hypothetical protein [Bacilli bacterium]